MKFDNEEIIKQFQFIQNYDLNLFLSQIESITNSQQCLIEQVKKRKDNINDDYDANDRKSNQSLIYQVQELYKLLSLLKNKNLQSLQQQQIHANSVLIKDSGCFNSREQTNQEPLLQSQINQQKNFIHYESQKLKSKENSNNFNTDDLSKENQQQSELKTSSRNEKLPVRSQKKELNSHKEQQEIIFIESNDEDQNVDNIFNQKNSQKMNENRFYQSINKNKIGLYQICQNHDNQQFANYIDLEDSDFNTQVYIGEVYRMENNSVYFYKIYNNNINTYESFKYYYYEQNFEQEKMFEIVIQMLKKVSLYKIHKINIKYTKGEQSLIFENMFNKKHEYKQDLYIIKQLQIFKLIEEYKIDYTQDNSIPIEELTNIYYTSLLEIKKWPSQADLSKKQQKNKEKNNNQNSYHIEIVSQEKSLELFWEKSRQEYEHYLKTNQKVPSNNPYYIMKSLNTNNNFTPDSTPCSYLSKSSSPYNTKRRQKTYEIEDEDSNSDNSYSRVHKKKKFSKFTSSK
ncbi:hypothetical protein ABPG74_016190 [Tetrahymena malaccensis]